MIANRRPLIGRQGIGVDSEGGSVVDPTENVKALSEAANKRQDDLRNASDRLHISETRRLEAEVEHVKELAQIREAHAKEMRAAEGGRLDSIRQVDVTAVKTEADRALAAIQTLAATTATNAENLRNALNTTATTIAKSTSDTVSQITERIAALEKSSYEGLGKQRIADPMMVEVMAEMKLMRGTKSEGIDKTWGIIAVVVTLVISGAIAFVAINRSPTSTASTPPQVIYLPSPAVATVPPAAPVR